MKLSKRIDDNIETIKHELQNSSDLVLREFDLNFNQIPKIHCALFYLEAMVSNSQVTNAILQPLMHEIRDFDERVSTTFIKFIQESALTIGEVGEETELDKVLLSIMTGNVILLIDGARTALTIDVKGWKHRGVESPQTEAVIRGPRDSFSEPLTINLTLIRRRLRDPDLVFERITLGKRGHNDIVLAYIKNLAHPDLIAEVRKRLQKIEVDVILDSGYVEQIIEDDWWSPFNTLQDSERPDEVVAGLVEGRVAILVDNSPFALLVPATLNSQMMSPEDYYIRWPAANFIRIIRFIASFVAFVTPSLYISLVSFHPEMIPTQLALSIAATRDGIPFPSFVEALMMELSLELLREAGIRLPGAIGQTIGIVGGLIIGDAAVRAGIVSPIMVIVVAMTAIAGFIIPTYTLSFGLRISRFFLMIISSLLGLYGLALGLLLMLGHLATLTSFGVSYLSPWAPLNIHDLRDSIIRSPWHRLKHRPQYTSALDPTRQATHTSKKGKAKKKQS